MSSPARKSGRQAKPTEKLKEYLHEHEEKPRKESKAPMPKAQNTVTSKENLSYSTKDNHTSVKKSGIFDVQMSASPARKSGREAKPTEKLKGYLHDYEMPIKLNKSAVDGHSNQISKDGVLKPVLTIQTLAKKRGRPSKAESDCEDIEINRKKFKKGKENANYKAAMQYPCSVCGCEVRNSSVWCTGCLKWCHKRCSGLKTLNKVKAYFKCPTCEKGNIKNIMVKMPEKEKKIKIIPDTKIYVVPKGWRRQAIKRMGGNSAGKFDVYYYSPKGTKLRSLKEVEKYCQKEGIEIDLSQFSFYHSEKGRLSLIEAGLPISPMKIITPKTPVDKKEVKETRGRPKGSTKFIKAVDDCDAKRTNEDQSNGKPVELSDYMDIYSTTLICSQKKNDKKDTLKKFRGRPRGLPKIRNEEPDNNGTKKDLSHVNLVEPKESNNGDTSPTSSPGLRKLRLVDNRNKSRQAVMTNIEQEDHSIIIKNSKEGVEVSVLPSVINSPVTKSGRQVKPTEKLKESIVPNNHSENDLQPSMSNKQAKHSKSLLASKAGYNRVVRDLSKNSEGSPNWDLSLARMTEVYSWVNTAPEEMKKKVHELTLRFFSCIEILQSKHRTSLSTQEFINV